MSAMHALVSRRYVQSKYLRTGGFRCLALAGKDPPALRRSNSANHLRTSVTIGSRRTPSFTRRTLTWSPSKRNSFGRRTAWLLPFRNNFATLVLAMLDKYIPLIYIKATCYCQAFLATFCGVGFSLRVLILPDTNPTG